MSKFRRRCKAEFLHFYYQDRLRPRQFVSQRRCARKQNLWEQEIDHFSFIHETIVLANSLVSRNRRLPWSRR